MELYMVLMRHINQIFEYVNDMFSEHVFRHDVISLLEIGAIVGYVLIIMLLYIIEHGSIKRIDATYKYKNIVRFIQIFIMLMPLSVLLISTNISLLMLCFMCYTIFFFGLETIKMHHESLSVMD
mgnify:CR=1 FL=1